MYQNSCNSLEILCIDKILLQCPPEELSKYESNIKEKILARLLNPHTPKFSYPRSEIPQPSPKYLSHLVDPYSTTHLDLTMVPSTTWYTYCTLSNYFPFSFLAECKNLKSLTVSHQPNFGIGALIPFLELLGDRLESLDLSGCIRLGDSALHYISYYCKSLRSLNLSDCIGIGGGVFQRSFVGNMALVPSKGIERHQVANNIHFSMLKMPSLLHLNLSGCKNVQPRNLYTLSTVFPSLQSLNFAKTFLSDEDGAKLTQGLPSTLTTLDISFNPIGKNTVKSLLPSTNNNGARFRLKALNVGYCRCLTTIDVRSILGGMSETLEHLSISGCSQIESILFQDYSSLSPSELLTIAKSLRILDISYCNQFTANALRPLQQMGCRDQVKVLKFNHKGFQPTLQC